MKIIKFIFLVLLLISINANSQTHEKYIFKADSLYQIGKYMESAEYYDDAFKLNHGSIKTYYNAACSWALVGNTIQALEYLNLSLKSGYRDLEHLSQDSDLISLHSTAEWNTILSFLKKEMADIDFKLKEKLENIYIKDQALRWLLIDAEKKFGKESEMMKYYWQLISKQDSINELDVVKIIETKGWLGTNIVGEQGNKALWLVIQHSSLDTQEKYLPLLNESVKLGYSNGNHLALLIDRIQMGNGEAQTYGSQVITDKETGEKKVYKIKEPEYVNKRRSEIGLESIEEYLQPWGIKWNIQQKM